jgi:phosphinothricin acetyltransferase
VRRPEIRPASLADAEAISGLYNALVATDTVAWTEEPESVEARRAWIRGQEQRGDPVLVADDGEVIGFTSYGEFRDSTKWPGYRFTVEHTIHVRGDRWGSGVGRALMEALFDHARAAGKHVMVGGIDGANDASLRFHEALGFVEVARMPEIGRKFDRWLDLVLVQRMLDP